MRNEIFDKSLNIFGNVSNDVYKLLYDEKILEANLHINHTQRLIQANVKNMCLDLAANNNNHLS